MEIGSYREHHAEHHGLYKFRKVYSACGYPSTPMEMLQVRFSNTTPTVSSQVCTVVYPPTSGDSHTIASLPQVVPPWAEKTALTLVRSVALWLPAWTSVPLAGLRLPRSPGRQPGG